MQPLTEVMTPYELHLLLSPSELARHRAALSEAAAVQQERRKAEAQINLFFEWMVRAVA